MAPIFREESGADADNQDEAVRNFRELSADLAHGIEIEEVFENEAIHAAENGVVAQVRGNQLIESV